MSVTGTWVLTRWRAKAAAVSILGLLWVAPASAQAQSRVPVIDLEPIPVFRPEPIPGDPAVAGTATSYRTWSLFLVCTPDWVMPARSDDLVNLYWRFEAFGDAIGADNAAVWFWKERMPRNDPHLAQNVDVARSADYCKALALRPSEGPFLVVTAAYPELTGFPKDRAIFTLGGLPPAELAKLLNRLTDELLLHGTLPTTASATPPAAATDGPGLWVRLLEGTRRTFIGVGCTVNLKISAGVLNAELRGCPT